MDNGGIFVLVDPDYQRRLPGFDNDMGVVGRNWGAQSR
jgi:hypothetical protein